MAQVTDIKRQKRDQGRFSVYIDGAYGFALTDLELSASSLRIGADLTQAEVMAWQERTESNKAYNQALHYLSFRPRSIREMRDYLKRKDWEPEMAVVIIDRLIVERYLDDEAFARSWVTSRRLNRPRSRSALQSELMLKGIDRETIGRVLDEDENAGDDSTLDDLIEKKLAQSRYQDPKKLMEYLSRQGFRYSDVQAALRRRED